MKEISKYTDSKLIRIYDTLLNDLEKELEKNNESNNIVIKAFKCCIKFIEEELEKKRITTNQ